MRNRRSIVLFIIAIGLLSIALAITVRSFVPRDNDIFIAATDPKNPLHLFRIPITYAVKKQSDLLSEGAKSDHEKIMRFMAHIDTFTVGVLDSESPESTLQQKKGACGSFVNTLLALAIAQGIEGRIVSMLNWPKGDGHALSELKVNGKWQLYDPTYAAYYHLKGDASKQPLSFQAIKDAYAKDIESVALVSHSKRYGLDSFAGAKIFNNANPSGIIGPDYPFIFPLSLNLQTAARLEKSQFGPTYQGANFLGVGSTNQHQSWQLSGLVAGQEYEFEVAPESLGGDIVSGDLLFTLQVQMDMAELLVTPSHVFDFGQYNETPEAWKIRFKADSDTVTLHLSHGYLGPQYRYMNMSYYALRTVS